MKKIFQKLNSFIDKHIVLCLSGIILINPLLDLVIGVTSLLFSHGSLIGIVVRGGTLVLLIQYLLFYFKVKIKQEYGWVLLAMIGFLIVHLAYIFLTQGLGFGIEATKTSIKFFYLPIVFYGLVTIYLRKKIVIGFWPIAIAAFAYSLMILFPIAIGMAVNSYSYLDKLGYNGWFYSANEIGAILAITYPVAFVYFMKISKRNPLIKILIILSIFTATMFIGTKVPFWAMLATTLTIGLVAFADAFKLFEKNGLLITTILCFVLMYFVLPYTPIGSNLSISMVGAENVSQTTGIKTAVEDPVAVLSGRNKKLDESRDNFLASDLVGKMIGLGASKGSQRILSIEMDIFDLFFDFGIIGSVVFMLPFIMYGVEMFNSKKEISWLMSMRPLAVIVSVGLGIGASILAGHVVSAPAVSVYLAFLMAGFVAHATKQESFNIDKSSWTEQALRKITFMSRSKAIGQIDGILNKKQQKLIVTANPEIMTMSLSDDNIKQMFEDKRVMIVPDGAGVVKGADMLGIETNQRIPGVELVQSILKKTNDKKLKVAVLGCRQEVLDVFRDKMQKQFPDIKFSKLLNGYSEPHQESMEIIIKNKPQVLLVALGAGAQEKLIYQNLDRLTGCVCIGVGGSIDVLSGKVSRAPEIIRRLNLEWLYRITKQPHRMQRFVKSQLRFMFVIFFIKITKMSLV